MRRLTALLLLLLTMTATALSETPQANLTGQWGTSTMETLCGVFLTLNPDNSFFLCMEGMRSTGVWSLDGYTLTLHEIVLLDTGVTELAQPIVWTLNTSSCDYDFIDIGSSLRLYRLGESLPVYWLSSSSEHYTSLRLMTSSAFYSESHDLPLDLTTPGDGDRTIGKWSASGLYLTLEAEDGTVQTGMFIIDPFDGKNGSIVLHLDGHEFYAPGFE